MAPRHAAGQAEPEILRMAASWDWNVAPVSLKTGARFPKEACVHGVLSLGWAKSRRIQLLLAVELHLKAKGGQPAIVALQIKPYDETPITPSTVHDLPLGWVAERLVTAVARAVVRLGGGPPPAEPKEMYGPMVPGWPVVELLAEDAAAGVVTVTSRRGRRVPGEILLRAAAILRDGHVGARLGVARTFGISEPTVDRWKVEAVKRGFLPDQTSSAG